MRQYREAFDHTARERTQTCPDRVPRRAAARRRTAPDDPSSHGQAPRGSRRRHQERYRRQPLAPQMRTSAVRQSPAMVLSATASDLAGGSVNFLVTARVCAPPAAIELR
eukprot:scaffold262684_cov32-Tisochrysis_lutea.AAC.1